MMRNYSFWRRCLLHTTPALLSVLLVSGAWAAPGNGPMPKPGNNGVPGRIAALRQEIDQQQQLIQDLLDENSAIKEPGRTGVNDSIAFGDDGDRQTGREWPEPRFTTNVRSEHDTNGNSVCDGVEICDGTVTDNLTELVWLHDANCFGKTSWFDAIALANNLSGDGSCGLDDGSNAGDWRVANINELHSLMDYSQTVPAPLLPSGHPFMNVVGFEPEGYPASYWTSTAVSTDTGGYAYTVSLGVGWVERMGLGFTTQQSWQVRYMQ